jgi:hypothetical protein
MLLSVAVKSDLVSNQRTMPWLFHVLSKRMIACSTRVLVLRISPAWSRRSRETVYRHRLSVWIVPQDVLETGIVFEWQSEKDWGLNRGMQEADGGCIGC